MGLLLKNGLVYDGTTNKPVVKDIYIENKIIKSIGDNISIEGAKVIDCTNLVVSPGFIDAHSHNDFFVNRNKVEKSITPFLKQGITSQVVGNCGFSAYAIDPRSKFKDIGGGLFKTNNPGSLNQFADDVKGKLIVNLIPLVGHCSTRISVVGNTPKKLTPDELDQQLALLEEGLKSGAFGGSFGLMYQPGMFAPKEELIEYAKVIKKYDGILTIHTRANSKVALGYPLLGKPHIEQGLDEVIDIMKETNVRVEYSHLIFVGQASWKCVDPMLNKIHEYRNQGFEIGYDMYPFTYGASVITVVLPSWYLKLSPKDRKKKFNRLKLKFIINVTKKLLGIDFSDMVIAYISPEHKEYEGKTITEAAKHDHLKPFDMYLKLVDLSNGNGRIMLGKYYNDEIIYKMMNDDISIYMTDAWYEEAGTQNAGTYQAFPFFLEKTRENNIDLEKTINKMTGATADRFQIKDRGFIKEGYAADITVFDYNEVRIKKNVPDETPLGIKYVIVNGDIAVENNKYLGTKSGVLLRKE